MQIADEPKITAYMSIYEDGIIKKNATVSSYIGIELRGFTSQYWCPKKQYGIETRKLNGENRNIALLGLPEENDWVLSAPYFDKSLIRNPLCYELYRSMGWYAPNTRHCILYLNNEYQGVYVLTEKIKFDKNRLNASTEQGNCFLLETTDANRLKKKEHYFTTAYWKRTQIFKYPKTPNANDSVYITNTFNQFEKALGNANYAKSNLEELARTIDINSLIDYIIIQETIKNTDSFYASVYWHKKPDGKLTAGPLWDCNQGIGNADYVNCWNYKGLRTLAYHYPKRLYENENFRKLLHKRWAELRSTILSEANIFAVTDSLATIVTTSADKNFEKWPILGKLIRPNYFKGYTHKEELHYLKCWFVNRLNWLDYKFERTGFYCEASPFDEYPTKILIHNNKAPFKMEQFNHINEIIKTEEFSFSDSIYLLHNLPDHSLFTYKITIDNDSIENNCQYILVHTQLSAPKAPTNFNISINIDSTITANWIDNSHNEEYFIIEKLTDSASPNCDTIMANAQSAQIMLPINERIKIKACNARGESEYCISNILYTPDSSFSLYPTVCSEYLYIESENMQLGTISLTIYDYSGKTVFHENSIKTDVWFNQRVSVRHLPPGFYNAVIKGLGKQYNTIFCKHPL